MTADNEEVVWIFVGGKNPNPSAAFSSRESAEEWIGQTKLSGMLTAYPLNVPVYDWAIRKGIFKPSKPYQSSPKFIAGFSSAGLEHYHYEDGVNETG